MISIEMHDVHEVIVVRSAQTGRRVVDGFSLCVQETGISTRAQELLLACGLRAKGYIPFFSSRKAELGLSRPGSGLLEAVNSKQVLGPQ